MLDPNSPRLSPAWQKKGNCHMTSTCNIAMYSPENVGLGHLRRNILIGRQLMEEAGDANVLLFANSSVAPFFELPDGMDLVKLPSVQRSVRVIGSRRVSGWINNCSRPYALTSCEACF